MKVFVFAFFLIASSTFAFDLSFLPFNPENKFSPLIPVANLDLAKYEGHWFEIARLPYLFELECYCGITNYTLNSDGTLDIYNACNWGSPSGKIHSGKGKALADDPVNGTVTTGKLNVEVFGFLKAPYYVIDLDENYQWALVGSPYRNFLWILTRTPSIENDLYDQLVDKAISLEFNVANFVRTYQGQGCGPRETLVSR